MRYGCHLLQTADRDGDPAQNIAPIWGGQTAPAVSLCPQPAQPAPINAGGTANTLVIPQHVFQLQEDLRALGVAVVGTPDGSFGLHTQWAVREFQIYAKMSQVARVKPGAPANLQQGAHLVATLGQAPAAAGVEPLSVYVDSLESVQNAAVYGGPVSGVVNEQTRDAIEHWLHEGYRCPVVVEAWNVNRRGDRTGLVADGVNLWEHDSLTNTAPRMFARDFSSYYTLPQGRGADEMKCIGDFATYLSWSGPRSIPPKHTWPEGELTPQVLLGDPNPTGNTLSTYRVVRSVAEVECMGFADSVNCYDNAFISVGPCHWTLGIVNNPNPTGKGELCGYLAYLAHADSAAFEQTMGFFGAAIDKSWVDGQGVANGADLFVGQRKYAAWISLQDDSGTPQPLPRTEAEGNWFKTWHWYYRLVMAGRTIEGYQQRMWDMARVRVRDFMAAPWGSGVAAVATTSPSGSRPATIGDVFSSEKSAALLLRWHIRSPGNVTSRHKAAANLRSALTDAKSTASGLTWTGDPSTWTDAHEAALIQGILNTAKSIRGLPKTMAYVDAWPNWLGGNNPRRFRLAAPIAAPLSNNRGSLDFDDAGLPPAPW